MDNLAGKVAVITGAAEGIGRALAVRGHAAGMKLVLADIDGPRLAETADALTQEGADVLALRTDVSVAAEVDALADAAFARFGAVHLLVNNAGVAVAKSAWETSLADWEWVLGVNLYGVIHGLRAFVPRMIEGGHPGHIVNVASIAGLISAPSMAAYNVSKHGVVTLSEGLHHDLRLRGAGIGVSVLCPAWVRTRIAESERNRDAPDRTRAADQGPIAGQAAQMVAKAVASGMDPAQLADIVFASIEANRFYILTHPETRAVVRARLDDILEDRLPTMPAMGFGKTRDRAP